MNFDHTIVVLKNGLRVVNFSSPHPFVFDDGSELPAVPGEVSRHLMLEQSEVEHNRGSYFDVRLSFQMSDAIRVMLEKLVNNPEVDIIIVPFPVMEACKSCNFDLRCKIKVCRVKDRVTKVIWSNRFCV